MKTIKEKTIIQVWGAEGGGKSETIKILREELQHRYIDPLHTYSLPLPPHDISDILICNGVTIGIESMGDYLNALGLGKKLTELITVHQCDIIICASRVYNDVSKHICHLAKTHGYRLLKVTNYRGTEPSFTQADLNQLSAQHLLDLVDGIIAGRI